MPQLSVVKVGRFPGPSTQRDPIGLAGGLNQYGYAGGDPVNYSDPFGLDGCEKNDLPCLAARAAAQIAAGVAGMLAGAGTGATLGTLACGPPACSAAGAAVGSLVGGIAGAQAAGQQFDAALEMANAGKGRGANQSPNNEVREIARRNNLNEAGRSELHRQISRRGMSREEIEEIAKTIGEQAKYTTKGTP